MQKDGNLELHANKQGTWIVIWASRTTAVGDGPYKLYLNEITLQLEIHDRNNDIVWNSDNPIPDSYIGMHKGRAILENNGNFFVYDGQKEIVWSSRTTGTRERILKSSHLSKPNHLYSLHVLKNSIYQFYMLMLHR